MLRFSALTTICLYVVMLSVDLTGSVNGDEIVLANRSSINPPAAQQSSSIYPQDSQMVTAGELWQFFHNQGITSVDRLTINVECGEFDPNQLGSFNLQIQDPDSGNVVTDLNIRPNTNKLEVPLEFDYMKRFSPESQELIRLDMSRLNALAPETTISLDSELSEFKPLNLFLLGGFLIFWIAVFFLLNRATRPLDQETEEIVIRTVPSEGLSEEGTEAVTSADPLPAVASNGQTGQSNNARSNNASNASVSASGVRTTNMVSAR